MYLGEVSSSVLQPIFLVEKSLSSHLDVYVPQQPSRRVKTLPKTCLDRLIQHEEFKTLIRDNNDQLGSFSSAIDKLMNGISISATIQYYSPSEPPLVPHVDSGELAVVIGLHLYSLLDGQADDSLRWLNLTDFMWKPVLMKVGSVVAIPCGVLHMVKRPVASERVTIIIMVKVVILVSSFIVSPVLLRARREVLQVADVSHQVREVASR